MIGQARDPVVDQEVTAALGQVYDPCSLAASSPLSLLDMGLIRGWTYDERTRHLDIVMIVTSPACFLSESMAAAIREQMAGVEAVGSVDIRIDSDVMWTPDMITPEAQAGLDRRRELSRRLLELRPRQWETAVGRE